jgi:hypothetical protein
MKPNAAWHKAHPMPGRATLQQRMTWHLGHAQACGCRAIPATVLAQLKKRGIKPPPRKFAEL